MPISVPRVMTESLISGNILKTFRMCRNFGENTFNFVVIFVPADGLAPLGAGLSVGIVMVPFAAKGSMSV